MSLTSLLDDDGSAVSRWFARTFPDIAAVRRAYAASRPERHVQRPVAPRSRVRWDLLGHAIDHRLRCAFTPSGSVEPVERGILIAARERSGQISEAVLRSGMELLELRQRLIQEFTPHRRGTSWLLPDAAEERLCRVCFAMAWFERAFRDGRVDARTPLGADCSITLDALLAAVPNFAVDDLRVQVALAQAALNGLRDSCPPDRCVSGPQFASSPLVGGADADLVVDGLLIDIKATTRTDRVERKVIHQLLGYVLLDTTDQFGINSVGLYLSRIGWLVHWQLVELLPMLRVREPLPQLRHRFLSFLTELQIYGPLRTLPGDLGDLSEGTAKVSLDKPVDHGR